MRVYELAKELNLESKDLLSRLQHLGIYVRSASSTLEPHDERRVRAQVAEVPSLSSVPPTQVERATMRRIALRYEQPPPGARAAGVDHAHYPITRMPDGVRLRGRHEIPRDALLHAMQDRRRPPSGDVFLDYNGAEHREGLCGVQIKIILPQWFNAGSVQACPDCVEALTEELARRARPD